MKILRTIRNYICYCGIEKEEYRKVKKAAYVSNFEVWRTLHILMDVAFLFLFIYSLCSKFADQNKWFYLGGLIYSVVATIVFFVVRKKDLLINQFLIYLSISVLLLFGCLITSNKAELPGITFIAFLLITPMFMLDKPFFMSIELVVASTVYLVWMHFVKTPEAFKIDLVNVIIFTLVGILIHIITNSIRIKEFVLIDKINYQKDFDELTGVKNKAALTREIGDFIEDGHTKKGLFFVLDINFFKQINDKYGHDVGDRILTEFGQYFRSKFTHDEIVGRFGGDEFIIFFKNTDDEEFAKKIALEISNDISQTVKLPDENEQITVSIGIAVYQGEEKHYSDIFKKADIALYQTKANRKIKFSINE